MKGYPMSDREITALIDQWLEIYKSDDSIAKTQARKAIIKLNHVIMGR